jgi:hypothetical protein
VVGLEINGGEAMKLCEYRGGCDLEGKRLFNAPPLKWWFCEAHFLEAVNQAAEIQNMVRTLPTVIKKVVEGFRSQGHQPTAYEVTIEVARIVYADADPKVLAEREVELLPIVAQLLPVVM